MAEELRRLFFLACLISGLLCCIFILEQDIFSAARNSFSGYLYSRTNNSSIGTSAKRTGTTVNLESISTLKNSLDLNAITQLSNSKHMNVSVTLTDSITKIVSTIEYKSSSHPANERDIVLKVPSTPDSNYESTQINNLKERQVILNNPDVILDDLERIITSRPESCKSCFPESSYVFLPPDVCSITPPKSTLVLLLLLIFTTHENTNERTTLRKTWASIANENTANVRYVFLLGKHKVPNLNEKALEEAKQYGDIIIKDFDEVYKNLTYKTLAGFQWASKYCSNARYVMKTDDDMWVNTPKLVNELDSWNIRNEIIGTCVTTASPIRDIKSKWYASILEYPKSKYPGFCSGTGYVTTINVVKDIVKVSPNIPYFHLEDVYVAICIRKLGYKLRKKTGFSNSKVLFDKCRYQNLITSHRVKLAEIETAWDARLTC